MTGRRPAWLFTASAGLALALFLSACGGGSGSSSSTAASAPTTAQTSPSGGSAPPPGEKKPRSHGGKTGHVKKSPESRLSPPSPAEVHRAGHAAGFLVGGGDNSVPTYGSEGSSAQRRLAEGVLAAYLGARAREDWSAACGYIAASTRGRLEEFAKGSGGKLKGCGPIVKALSGAGSGASLADSLTHGLASLRVKGKNGFALWIGPNSQKYAMPMARDGGAWKVTQLAPLPYPPGSAP